jgi:hypothetical protein
MKSVAGGDEQTPYPVKPGTIPGLNKRYESQLGLEMPIDGWRGHDRREEKIQSSKIQEPGMSHTRFFV